MASIDRYVKPSDRSDVRAILGASIATAARELDAALARDSVDDAVKYARILCDLQTISE